MQPLEIFKGTSLSDGDIIVSTTEQLDLILTSEHHIFDSKEFVKPVDSEPKVSLIFKRIIYLYSIFS